MLSFKQAREIAETELQKEKLIGDIRLVIIDEMTIETPYAWIFHYNSKRYIETGDITEALGGNSPLFISKSDGKVSIYRSGLAIDGMIAAFEEEHKTWNLVLADNIYSNVTKLLYLKRVLNLSNVEIAEYKRVSKSIIDIGAKARLLKIQAELIQFSIKTNITLINQS